MIGHLFTLLFVGADAPPPISTSGGSGGPDGGRYGDYEEPDLYERIRIEAERTRAKSNMAAVHLILALAASGEFD